MEAHAGDNPSDTDIRHLEIVARKNYVVADLHSGSTGSCSRTVE